MSFYDPLLDSKQQYNKIKTPDLKWQTYDPESIAPQSASATLIGDDALAKSAQMSALNKMGDLSKTGLSAVDEQGYQNARDMGNQMANSGSQAAMQNAQARGIGGSGMEFANREIANQQGAQRAQQAGLHQNADSARQRALYNQAYEQGMGNYRAQNNQLSGQNAGILNQFNMANTQAANSAQAMNAMNNNQAQLTNTQGRNNVAQGNFTNQLGLAGAKRTANKDMADGEAAMEAADAARTNQMIQFGFGAMGMGMIGGDDGTMGN